MRAQSTIAVVLAVTLAAGCGKSEQQGREWFKRVLKETPRIAQLLFRLPSTPLSSYNPTGQYPNWVGEIT